MMTEVGAVLIGALLDIFLKLLALENSGVFGKQAEQKPHHIEFQRMTAVTGILHLVVQFAHLLGSLDVDWVLLLNLVSLITGDKTEQADVFMQILQVEFVLFVFFQIVKTKVGKVGNDYILGQVALAKACKIIQRLRVSFIEIFTA